MVSNPGEPMIMDHRASPPGPILANQASLPSSTTGSDIPKPVSVQSVGCNQHALPPTNMSPLLAKEIESILSPPLEDMIWTSLALPDESRVNR